MGVDDGVTEDEITITWDGRRIPARPREPIAVALWRAGERVQTRSIKFHRPRGPMCMTGDCPGCLVRVDGVPNMRGCRVPAREGLEVESQTGIPSAKRDLLGIVDRVVDRFDHERAFVRPGPVRAVYQAVARQLAGFGDPPTGEVDVLEGQELAPEVLVAGGGPAGLAAAHAAGEYGADVLLVDEAGFGGSLRHTLREVDGGSLGQAPGPELAERMLEGLPGPVGRRSGTVLGRYEDGTVVLERSQEGLAVHRLRPERTVLAVGATEGPARIPGNDIPGVLAARGARILLNRWGVEPGDPVALIDPGREGEAFAREARQAGLAVRRVEDAQAIEGDPTVGAVRTLEGKVPAEAAVVDPGLTPAPELGRQAEVPYRYEAALGGRVPLHRPDGATPVRDVLVAGSCAGLHVPEAALLQGRWAGEQAAGGSPEVDPKRLLQAPNLRPEEQDALETLWRRR